MRPVQRRQGPVEPVKAFVRRLGQKPPLERRFFVPFPARRELVAHKTQLLARRREEVQPECAQLPHLFVGCPVNLPPKRPLAVHNLIVRQRQKENVAVKILHRVQDLLRKLPALVGPLLHVIEHLVHPAHVPFVVKPEAAVHDRCRHLLVDRRILRNAHRARVPLLELVIRAAQHPDAGFVEAARLVPARVNQPRHRVVADAVEVVVRQPEVERRF